MPEPAFDVVVVGSGGGPDETDLSGYLMKACGSMWADGILAIEAGSGLGALKRILRQKPDLFADDGATNSKPYTASQIYSYVEAFLISHAHLDHVLSLTLQSGAVGGPRKSILGSEQVLKDLEENIFRPGRVWPDLASWNKEDADFKYRYESLEFNNEYASVHKDFSVCMMPISHGSNPVQYQSSAFFIKHNQSGQELLFFGDVEPDSVSANPRNIDVWRSAAPKIPQRLNTIFIECSYPLGRPDDQLYGHLAPEHLAKELENLAKEVLRTRNNSPSRSRSPSRTKQARKRQRIMTNGSPEEITGVLKGLRIVVTHFKEDMNAEYDQPMHFIITNQVRELVEEKKLGVEVIAAVQGDHIVI